MVVAECAFVKVKQSRERQRENVLRCDVIGALLARLSDSLPVLFA